VQIVPVLAQKAEAVRRYIEETGLPFNILVDESREVVKAYGVWHRIGLDAWNIARPAVFLVGTDQAVRYSFVADRQHEFPSHEEMLAGLKAMPSSVPTLGPRPEAES
jgi:peroxiredoxin